MNERIFLVRDGKIEEISKNQKIEGKCLFLNKVPNNYLELMDELKKLSFVCHAIYITINEKEMSIGFVQRDNLEAFTKVRPHLVEEKTLLKVNERLRGYLYALSES